jgi:hypothetical protein
LFNGEGQTLGGNSETSRLLRNTNSARRRASAVEKVVEETVLPGWRRLQLLLIETVLYLVKPALLPGADLAEYTTLFV